MFIEEKLFLLFTIGIVILVKISVVLVLIIGLFGNLVQ
jgi:hypothetical protein